MKISALIPARYDSVRFPGKLMKKLGRKSVIRQTYESVLNSKLFDEICVITDSKLIYNSDDISKITEDDVLSLI